MGQADDNQSTWSVLYTNKNGGNIFIMYEGRRVVGCDGSHPLVGRIYMDQHVCVCVCVCVLYGEFHPHTHTKPNVESVPPNGHFVSSLGSGKYQ
jgi:hypothetical protein